jgi:hypothetical protein
MRKKLLLSSILTMFLLAACTTAAPAPSQDPSTDPTAVSSSLSVTPTVAPSDCEGCHKDAVLNWEGGAHANTQSAVAKQLSQMRAGQTSEDVINGSNADDCIACHGPRAVAVAGIVTKETEALDHFFNTTDGKFNSDTQSINSTDWPQINCATCHQVADEHSKAQLEYGIYNSKTAQFTALDDSSKVCGQCHGSLLTASRDHQIYDAWKISKHSDTQTGIANVIGLAFKDWTPADVINRDGNCIACHAPTAVLANGGMTDADATAYFYTTTDGKFSANTTVDHASEWPNVSCTACHDPHNPSIIAFFNSTTRKYEPVTDNNDLCGQCHGNKRFTNSKNLSYNIIAGSGGMNVPDQQMEPNVVCTDCHMYTSDAAGSNSAVMGGHTWAITVREENGNSTSSCTHCHADMDAVKSDTIIKQFQSEFKDLDTRAKSNMENAKQVMDGVSNPDLQAKLKEAQFNLTYAESDESSGYHNHTYLMALLNDTVQRTQEILTALGK